MKYYVLIICLFSSISLYAKLREIPVKLSLATMFAPDISYTTGIKGSVNAGGKIDIKIVDKQTGYITFSVHTKSKFIRVCWKWTDL